MGSGEIAQAVPEPDKEILRWKPRQKLGTVDIPISSRRGKGGRDTSGWAVLPPVVLRLILTYALADITIDPLMKKRQAGNRLRATVILGAITRRAWMWEMRLVSSSWKKSVDDHPFWNTLRPLLYHNYPPFKLDRVAESDLVSSKSSSTGTGPKPLTAFELAYQACASVCIPCCLNFGYIAKPNLAMAEGLVQVKSLGWLSSCERHIGRYCTGCLVSLPFDVVYSVEDGNGGSDIYYSHEDDTDEFGHRRPESSSICSVCRQAGIDVALTRALTAHARGGPVRSRPSEYAAALEYIYYVKGEWGTSARIAAESILYRYAVMGLDGGEDGTEPGARYWTKEALLLELHDLDNRAKCRFLAGEPPEDWHQRQQRWQLIRRIRPCKDINVTADTEERNALVRQWDMEWQVRGQDAVIQDMKAAEHADELGEKHNAMLFHSLVDEFILERLRLGIWVLPSTEVELMRGFPADLRKSEDHTSSVSATSGNPPHPYCPQDNIRQLLLSTSHPFPEHHMLDLYISPKEAGIQVAAGQFCLVRGIRDDPSWPSPGLPPPSLVRLMDTRFNECLSAMIKPGLARLAQEVANHVGDDTAGEQMCEKMDLRGVLYGLRSPEAWTTPPEPVRSEAKLKPHGRAAQAEARHKMKRSESTPGKQPSGQPAAVSPRIELVPNEEGDESMLADYGIKAEMILGADATMASAPMSEGKTAIAEPLPNDASTQQQTLPSAEETISTIPARTTSASSPAQLGKRKSPPAELVSRPTKGSRETSTSIESNAASTEGEDVVMPITPEDVAVETLGSVLLATAGKAGGVERATGQAHGRGQDLPARPPEIAANPPNTAHPKVALHASTAPKAAVNVTGEAPAANGDSDYEDDYSSTIESDAWDEDRASPGVHDEEADEYDLENEDGSELSEPTPSPPAPGASASSSATTRKLISAIENIPYVPFPATSDPDDPIGSILASDLIMRLWYEARQPLRDCSCQICERQMRRGGWDILRLLHG